MKKVLSVCGFPVMVLGCAAEAEVYPRAQASTVALVGSSCELSSAPSEKETVIEHPESCGEGVCLSMRGSAPSCSCRCSGPAEGLPLCDCPNAFHCQDEVVASISAGNVYAGGYCVAD